MACIETRRQSSELGLGPTAQVSDNPKDVSFRILVLPGLPGCGQKGILCSVYVTLE